MDHKRHFVWDLEGKSEAAAKFFSAQGGSTEPGAVVAHGRSCRYTGSPCCPGTTARLTAPSTPARSSLFFAVPGKQFL